MFLAFKRAKTKTTKVSVLKRSLLPFILLNCLLQTAWDFRFVNTVIILSHGLPVIQNASLLENPYHE